MGLKNGLYIYMIRQFFRNIPKEMEEAAYVDGCGMLETFVKIMLPDAKPILTSCFLFAFVWQWTDSFYSKMFLGNIKLFDSAGTDWRKIRKLPYVYPSSGNRSFRGLYPVYRIYRNADGDTSNPDSLSVCTEGICRELKQHRN